MKGEPRLFGVILGGGLARRMGGGLKILVEIAGEPILHYIMPRLETGLANLALNINETDDRLKSLDLPLISDEIEGFAGPLAGVHAAMGWAINCGALPDDYVVTVAGDTPFFPLDYIERMHASICEFQPNAGVARTPDGPQPTFAFWRIGLRDRLADALANEQRKILKFAEDSGFVWIDFTSGDDDLGVDPFFNINWRDDVVKAERVVALWRSS